jgi:hypothetical protein
VLVAVPFSMHWAWARRQREPRRPDPVLTRLSTPPSLVGASFPSIRQHPLVIAEVNQSLPSSRQVSATRLSCRHSFSYADLAICLESHGAPFAAG